MKEGMEDHKGEFTKLPNVVLDVLMAELNGSALKVFLSIIRKTTGWQKDSDKISYSQIQEITGLHRESISRAISVLQKKELISINKDSRTSEYQVNFKALQSVRKSNQSNNQPVRKSDHISSKNELVDSSIIEHTKETITKETKQKRERRAREGFSVEDFLKAYEKPPADRETFNKQWIELSLEDQKKALDGAIDYQKYEPQARYRKNPENYIKSRYWENEFMRDPNNWKKGATGAKVYTYDEMIDEVSRSGALTTDDFEQIRNGEGMITGWKKNQTNKYKTKGDRDAEILESIMRGSG